MLRKGGSKTKIKKIGSKGKIIFDKDRKRKERVSEYIERDKRGKEKENFICSKYSIEKVNIMSRYNSCTRMLETELEILHPL